jgi:hypothetical protein
MFLKEGFIPNHVIGTESVPQIESFEVLVRVELRSEVS